jgi:hypothetical protein
LIPLLLLAAAIPGIYWDQSPDAASTLKAAGIECVEVPPAKLQSWKSAGYCATAADLSSREKLPAPGVEFRPDVASATTAPWVISNGARLLRSASKAVYYPAGKNSAALAAAESSVYGVPALVQATPADLATLGPMLRFLRRAEAKSLPVRADIGFEDDGSPESLEVMNLLIRRNLLFRILKTPDPALALNVRLGDPDFPRSAAANPSEFAARVRQKLTDAKRSLRIYGSEVVIARLTGDESQARLLLLNYGPRKVEGLRVRVKGLYRSAKLSAPDAATPEPTDLQSTEGATEFSLPILDQYAVVDLR